MGVSVHAGVSHAQRGPEHCSMALQHSCGVLWGGARCATPSCSSRFVLSPHCISCVYPQGESGELGPKGQVSDGGGGSKGLPTLLHWVALRDPGLQAILLTEAVEMHRAGACCTLVA